MLPWYAGARITTSLKPCDFKCSLGQCLGGQIAVDASMLQTTYSGIWQTGSYSDFIANVPGKLILYGVEGLMKIQILDKINTIRTAYIVDAWVVSFKNGTSYYTLEPFSFILLKGRVAVLFGNEKSSKNIQNTTYCFDILNLDDRYFSKPDLLHRR